MNYTFMDFCAGIWWWRLWLQQAWFKCIAFSEIDKKAEQTYRVFFGNEEKNYWDLMSIIPSELPDFDLLIAGFPCQTFSVLWQRKWMEDPRWQIIFWIEKILKEKRIKYFILENVKGLVNHEGWETLKSIIDLLWNAWYYVDRKVLNTLDYWLPQSRERVYFLWVRKDLCIDNVTLQFPEKLKREDIKNYLIDTSKRYNFSDSRILTMMRYLNNKYNAWKYSLKDLIKKEWYIIDTRQSDIRFFDGICPTLRKWRHWLIYSKDWKLREISWLEALLLQGIPYEVAKKTEGVITDRDLLWQAWNAMSVNVIKQIGEKFMNFILKNIQKND